MSRTIFNELGESRVINPRSGFSQFVDLSNNQSIYGIKIFVDDIYLNSNLISTGNISTTGTISGTFINNNQFVDLSNNQTISSNKRFLNDLITNSNVNFNTTANIGRIVFKPNEPVSGGGKLLTVYLVDENDGQGWIFDANGNFYYIGSGLSPVKIQIVGSTGDITTLGNINGIGNITCQNILSTNIIQAYSGGNITFNNNIILGGNTISSGNITSSGTINTVDLSSSGIIYGNNIISSSTTGSYQTKIALSNEFIDINNSSLDIIAQYIGFGNPQQTLTTASKYMYIKPLSTGDFEIRINNITNKVLATDWSQLATATQMTTSFYSTSNVLMGFINPNPPAGVSPTMRIMGTSNQYIYYNTSNNFGNFNSTTSITNWEIFNNGNFVTLGTITGTTVTGITLVLKNASAITNITLDATTTSGNRLEIFGVASGTKYLYYNTSNILGAFNTSTSTSVWTIDGTSGNINTIGTINSNTINANTGTTISSSSIWNFKNASAITNIILDSITTSGNRLQIYGVASGTKYLYYNTSNNIGVFNTSTGTSVWSIDGTSGNIVSIGSFSVASFSATSILCNSISPLSGTTFTFGITSNCNWLKSAGVNRILMFPASTSGDIMQITRVGDTSYTSGYWYFNNSGNLGYNTGGVTVWELLNNGGMNLINLVSSGYLRSNFLYAYTFSTYQNIINMNTLTTSTSISGISIFSQYVNFIHPSVTPSTLSKYMFIVPDSGGNFTININNVGSRVLQTDWSNLILRTDYNFQTLGKYNYIAGEQQGSVCGHWSERTDAFGKPITNNGNSWVTMGGMNNNNGLVIGAGVPNAGSSNRSFTWLIENTVFSGKALGLAVNRTNEPFGLINTSSQATGFLLLGFFATNRGGGAAYSFTGEHSSMICDEEYNDIMNYNTDDFIGMVVCSSGKIYNLPYDIDGNTYEKQVDNIKSIDAQPMTKLSKKYKDKSVLGIISHIEKVGKDRNNITGGCWTAAISLDNDARRRIRVASIGEGAVWVTNEYGNIENGDYITTSKIAGYSTKQDSDFLMNYTIAKATMDCDFDIEKPDEYKTKYLGDGIYASYIACTYHSG